MMVAVIVSTTKNTWTEANNKHHYNDNPPYIVIIITAKNISTSTATTAIWFAITITHNNTSSQFGLIHIMQAVVWVTLLRNQIFS